MYSVARSVITLLLDPHLSLRTLGMAAIAAITPRPLCMPQIRATPIRPSPPFAQSRRYKDVETQGRRSGVRLQGEFFSTPPPPAPLDQAAELVSGKCRREAGNHVPSSIGLLWLDGAHRRTHLTRLCHTKLTSSRLTAQS